MLMYAGPAGCARARASARARPKAPGGHPPGRLRVHLTGTTMHSARWRGLYVNECGPRAPGDGVSWGVNGIFTRLHGRSAARLVTGTARPR